MSTKKLIHCPDWATALLNGFSQVLLQRNPLCGLFCLAAILFTAPDLLGGALLGALSGLLTAQRRSYARSDRQSGLYSYNGVLLGLLICHQLPWSALVPPLIIAASGLSSIFVHQWIKRADRPVLLPAYTSPFVLLGWALLLAVEPAASSPIVVDHNPLSALARGLGQIFLLDHPFAGVLIAIGLLIANRYAAAWALVGSAIGGSVALFNGEANAAFYGLYGFNAALAALAFSHTRQQPWRPLLAIALAIVLQPALTLLPVPILTAPFILACWLLHIGSRWATHHTTPPDQALRNLARRSRAR
ncbi:urea transporter [Pseudomonas sp. R5(2019)]|uniref:urea transporter n=1 Tax=Pseudomonas sp. R5(2019) TaxID=2697566 RepID=UPI0014128D36|nr:urea transporter [Pseudomonas sp. R5(2019)]NBA93862.1 urea transporter [Pseudomonas sp. R5(2019)]